jgi:hypothetical protein
MQPMADGDASRSRISIRPSVRRLDLIKLQEGAGGGIVKLSIPSVRAPDSGKRMRRIGPYSTPERRAESATDCR